MTLSGLARSPQQARAHPRQPFPPISKSNQKISPTERYFQFYEKFALGFACIILFFIGAPLGALIRKGGFGLPIIIAIILFLTYHFIGIFAKNSARIDDVLGKVDMKTKGFKFPYQLSGGEQQRIAIARALLNDPRELALI